MFNIPLVINLKTLRQWNSKSLTAEAIIATPHSQSKVVTISTGSISSKSIPWRVLCILFAFVCIALILQDPRAKFIQLWDGKFVRETATFPNDIRKQKHICFSFPVQSRDLWTCGSCKSFAASLQYLLANLLWWKHVGGSWIHPYFLLSSLLDHALSVLADHRSAQLLAWGTSTKWKKTDWRFGIAKIESPWMPECSTIIHELTGKYG